MGGASGGVYVLNTHTHTPDKDMYINKDTHRHEVKVNMWRRGVAYIMKGVELYIKNTHSTYKTQTKNKLSLMFCSK